MKRTRNALFFILTLSVVLPALTLLIPAPSDMPAGRDSSDFRVILMAATFFAWLYIGAAILFSMGLDAFKEELRRAFKLVCVGLIATGVALVAVPTMVALNSISDAWEGRDLVGLPYAVAALALYVGIRSFAKTLEVKSVLTRILPVLTVTLGVSLASGLLLDTEYKTQFIVDICNFMLEVVSLALMIKIKRAAGPSYTNALAWFIIALSFGVISLAAPTIMLATGSEPEPIVVVPVVIAAGLFLRTGYAFNKIKEY